jgi:hypothetical protein
MNGNVIKLHRSGGGATPEIWGGGATLVANILQRRGFLTVHKNGRAWHTITLTEAGREALARRHTA